MLKSKFEEVFSRIKEYLPTTEAREVVKKVLQECDILTQSQMQEQLAQLQTLQDRLKELAARIDELEKKNKK